VNGIAPGSINTELLSSIWADLPEEHVEPVKRAVAASTIQGRIGEPREIADAVIFMASNAASFITGQTLVVDGGYLVL
jgi:NAD(P)-dependent dehydrogenase (short-subunit alcohol dehydrogenase family)